MSRKVPLAIYLTVLVVALLVATWFSAETLIFAQSDPVPLPDSTNNAPDDNTEGTPILEMSEEQQQQQDAAIATLEAEFLSRSILDYRIAYLVADDAEFRSEVITPENISTQMGAEVVNTWDEFLHLNEEQPFQIVLIHVSMLEQIDLEWTHNAYKNRVILVGINFDHEQMQEMTGDRCIKNMNPQIDINDYTASFKIFTYTVVADPELLEAIHHAELVACGDYDARGATTGVRHGQANYELERQEHLDLLVGSLITKTMSYGFSNPETND
jgi:hypothetical protein